MSEVASEVWKRVKIGETFDTVTGNTPSKSEKHFYGNAIPLVKPPELLDGDTSDASDGLSEDGRKVSRIAPAGSVLVSCIGNLGKIGLATRELAFNQQINAIMPDRSIADPKFVFFYCLSPSFGKQLEALSSGTTVAIVNKSRFNSIEMPLPPLNEQKRIVAVLEQAFAALDRVRANAEANLADAAELFDRELDLAFSKAGESAELLPFAKLCETVTPKVKIKRKDYLSEGKHPIVSQESDLVSGYWNDGNALMQFDNPVVVFGDHTRCLKFVDFDFVVGADGTKILRPFDSIDSLYLYYGLRSIPMAEKGYARHFRFLKEAKLPALELNEQKRLAQRIEEIEARTFRLADGYEEKLDDIDDLRQSILQKAFAGELT